MQVQTKQLTSIPGRAEVVFGREHGGPTFVRRQFATYPYHFCRAHRFAGDADGMATLYVQSLSGGIYEDERLSLTIAAEPEARAHLTSQSSTVVHSMDGGHAETSVEIDAREGSIIEYMTDPFILFPGARLTSKTRIQRHETAVAICADAFLTHDPKGIQRFFGCFDSCVDITDDDGRLLARDRMTLDGGSFLSRSVMQVGGYAGLATVTVVSPPAVSAAVVETMRKALDEDVDIYAGVSTLPNDCGAWTRLLATDGASLRTATETAWAAARKAITGEVPPRRRK